MRYARSARQGDEAFSGQPEGESEPPMSFWQGTRSKPGDDRQIPAESDRHLHEPEVCQDREDDGSLGDQRHQSAMGPTLPAAQHIQA